MEPEKSWKINLYFGCAEATLEELGTVILWNIGTLIQFVPAILFIRSSHSSDEPKEHIKK